MLLALALAQLADLVTFAAAVSVLPIEYEANVVMRTLGMHAGLGAAVLVKAVGIAVMVALAGELRARASRAVLWGCLFIGIGFGLSGAAANAAALVAGLCR